jgi:hypothetical protein
MCKNCWHSWRTLYNYEFCPKCKSKNIDKIPVVIFKTEEKKSENSPDYQIIWSQPKKQNNESQTENDNPFSDDDIPF